MSCPPVEIGGVQSFTLNTNPKTKEQPMPILPDIPTGMTKTRMWEQHQRTLADLETEVELRRQAERELNAERNQADPEARALSECVGAIERMFEAIQFRASNTSSSPQGRNQVALQAQHYDQSQPPALNSPVGRILVHLAARYALAVVALPPPVEDEPNVEGSELVIAPAKLARRIEQLLRDNPWALEDLR